ncbi:MAG: diadenylate cyclase CdaA [Lachnospiraceae bacterium]|nr:diadenylate cyclase CdaA [Clostridiales bacterium]MDY3110331.1 diadenylate cyclase CdaA [Lachnospiraceae bacterium]
MEHFKELFGVYSQKIHMPAVRWTDIVEILIIAFLVYQIMKWAKTTRAWSLFKGLVVILVFILLAVVFHMNTILWIVRNVISIAAISLVVVLQPELRRALETLGQKNYLASILNLDLQNEEEGLFSNHTIDEIVRGCVEMGKAKTGALIVIEQNQPLTEYERTGIDVDGVVSSQLLINIFEHNTPLHDGAVIIRGNRITSATCYLPLSDNLYLSKELGTRHRAGVGISENTDSLTIIVSEETGKISVAYKGNLERSLNADRLRERLVMLQNKPVEDKKRKLWKGRSKTS